MLSPDVVEEPPTATQVVDEVHEIPDNPMIAPSRPAGEESDQETPFHTSAKARRAEMTVSLVDPGRRTHGDAGRAAETGNARERGLGPNSQQGVACLTQSVPSQYSARADSCTTYAEPTDVQASVALHDTPLSVFPGVGPGLTWLWAVHVEPTRP